jgi:hypothetical protein
MDLKPRDAGLRVIDISKCLQEVSVGAPHYHFRNADEIGGATRLAQSIKGTETMSWNGLPHEGKKQGAWLGAIIL